MNYDAIIIGTGFGGTIAAVQMAAKGKSVLLLERGTFWRSPAPLSLKPDTFGPWAKANNMPVQYWPTGCRIPSRSRNRPSRTGHRLPPVGERAGSACRSSSCRTCRGSCRPHGTGRTRPAHPATVACRTRRRTRRPRRMPLPRNAAGYRGDRAAISDP